MDNRCLKMYTITYKIVLLSVLFGLSIFVIESQARDWYVDKNASGANNGTSWDNAWVSLTSVKGVTDGDTIYISGGSSGKTYSISNWNPAGGSSNYVTYRVGQDAGHNGTVTFTGLGNWLNGTLNYVSINGEINGKRRMVVDKSYNWTFYDGNSKDGSGHLKLLYIEFTRPIFAETNYIEIAYCQGIAPQGSWLDDSYISHIGEDNGSGSFTENLIHHNYFKVWHKKTQGWGHDIFKWFANVSIYNNTLISGYWSGYNGGQHNDGIQSTGWYVAIYNNYFENFISYPIYNEMYGDTYHWRIYNNVIYSNEEGVDWGAYKCMAIGPRGDYTIKDYIVSNNVCIGGADGPLSRPGISFNYPETGTVGSDAYIVNNLVSGHGNTTTVGGGGIVSKNVKITDSSYFRNLAPYPDGDFRLKIDHSDVIVDRGGKWTYVSNIFDTDKDGKTRSSRWDIGAYEYNGIDNDESLFAPTNLRIIE
jgi:hypothetical protein